MTCVYPFSIAPTSINANWDNVERAMMRGRCARRCADAGKSVLVRANCQHCNRAITIDVEPDRLKKRTPRSTVIIRRRTVGPAAASRCAATRFACSPDHAQQWIHEHGGPDDVIQSLEASFIEGRTIFANAYRHGSSAHHDD
ncbi:MAG: organomercurial lyase [Thermomicrobiales bacterium]|nr:organomercurial lyase [Thermomicrobiales bacterium]